MIKCILITMAALLLFASGPKQQELKNELGVAIAWQRGQDWANQSLETLGQPIWHNWVYDNINDERYYPKIFSVTAGKNTNDNLIELINQNSHKIWLIANEPENSTSVSKVMDVVNFNSRIRAETNARYACCGIILGPNWPYGIAWMNSYILNGGDIPDYWHIHIYFHHNHHGWQQSLDQFVTWTKNNNAVRPIIISETAMTETYQDARVDKIAAKNLMIHIYQQMKTGVPYTVFWYSDIDYWGLWPQSNLLNSDGTLPELGELFIRLRDTKYTFLPIVGRNSQP